MTWPPSSWCQLSVFMCDGASLPDCVWLLLLSALVSPGPGSSLTNVMSHWVLASSHQLSLTTGHSNKKGGANKENQRFICEK